MTISLLKYAVRLFIRAAADVDLLRCMIFSNFKFFKFVCIFGIPKFNMNVMNRFSVMHRASEFDMAAFAYAWAPLERRWEPGVRQYYYQAYMYALPCNTLTRPSIKHES